MWLTEDANLSSFDQTDFTPKTQPTLCRLTGLRNGRMLLDRQRKANWNPWRFRYPMTISAYRPMWGQTFSHFWLILLLLLLWPVVAFAAPSEVPVQGRIASEAGGPGKPQKVPVGFYLQSVYGLNQQASTYYLDFYLWMRWRGEIDPTATLELINNVERWGLTQTPLYEKPIQSKDGESFQIFHIQGNFFLPMGLNDYPLDKHALLVKIQDSTYTTDKLVYVMDQKSTAINPELKLPGWNTVGYRLSNPEEKYNTDFGDPTATSSTFSSAIFTLDIARPVSFFLWKLLLPLFIVLLLALSVLLVHPSFTEVRLAGPASAVLTLVFLQQTYSSSLPENGVLVLLDKIYGLAYVLVIGVLISTIVTSYWARTDAQGNMVRALRLDRITMTVLVSMFLVGTLLMIMGVQQV